MSTLANADRVLLSGCPERGVNVATRRRICDAWIDVLWGNTKRFGETFSDDNISGSRINNGVLRWNVADAQILGGVWDCNDCPICRSTSIARHHRWGFHLGENGIRRWGFET